MKAILFSAAAIAFVSLAAPAHAQATRTWVSGTGDDINPCSRTAPCKTFAGAISKTATSGEINCLDPGGFGSVSITKAITIDCYGVIGGILNSGGGKGIVINAPGATVHLRNLSINGVGSGAIGVHVLSAVRVNLENLTIANHTQEGILFASTWGGSMLVVKNSTISYNALSGIVVKNPGSGGALIDNVVSKQNNFGVAVGPNNVVTVVRSNISNSLTAGVQSDTGGTIVVEDSTLNNNPSAFQIAGAAAVGNTSIYFNTTGFAGAGTITTFGNNRLFGNTSIGNALTPAGTASADLGQK